MEVTQLKVRTGSLRGVIAVSSVSGLLTSKFEALSGLSKVILRDPCNQIPGSRVHPNQEAFIWAVLGQSAELTRQGHYLPVQNLDWVSV